MRNRPRSLLATSLTISFWREMTVERWSFGETREDKNEGFEEANVGGEWKKRKEALPSQQVLSGEKLAALQYHDGLAVHAAVEFLQTSLLFMLVHLAVDCSNHLFHQPNGLIQIIVVFICICGGEVATG
ncbi:hypothetical protein XENOCAPTIV_005126 [Xenoophorus captivus]|uniref:Uncharacterized protein n=1 Tax=Xenoophorus captivus TaxID=1517983 RepID=A0ABV0QMF5_9TELE